MIIFHQLYQITDLFRSDVIHYIRICSKILLTTWRLSLGRWLWYGLLLNGRFWCLWILYLIRNGDLYLNLWWLGKWHLLLLWHNVLMRFLVLFTMSKVTTCLILTKSLHEIFALNSLIVVLALLWETTTTLNWHFRHT